MIASNNLFITLITVLHAHAAQQHLVSNMNIYHLFSRMVYELNYIYMHGIT